MAWINKDWLKKLGLEMPKTTDDLIKVLEAFKNRDPNGNGEADEIPFSFISGNGNEDFKFLFAAFGIGDNDDHLVVGNDGKVDFTADNDNYKEGVKFIRQLQEKGLIDKEASNMIGIVTLLKVMIRNLVFTLHGIRIMLLEVTKVMMFYQYLLDQVVKTRSSYKRYGICT